MSRPRPWTLRDTACILGVSRNLRVREVTMSARSIGVIAVILLSTLAPACSKKESAETSSASDAPLEEAFAKSSIAWVVKNDGRIRADVKDASGAPISSDATGTVEWTTESGEARSAKLAYDAEAKVLVAAGPAPTQDITPIKYQIVAKGDTLAGTLHVPVGGTAALAANANDVKDNAGEAKGPVSARSGAPRIVPCPHARAL
jgi:hypothetical protein